MHGAQRAGGLATFDDCRNVALRSALRNRPYIDVGRAECAEYLAGNPGMPAMPSPTTARMAISPVTPMLCTCPWASSWAKARSNTAVARATWPAGMAQQMECSELACEIRMTDMSSSRSAPNSRCAVPGTPIMPAPSRLSSATFSMLVMPLTGWLLCGLAQINVPGFSGAKVLRIQIGMSRPIAGAMVWGWITLAPK